MANRRAALVIFCSLMFLALSNAANLTSATYKIKNGEVQRAVLSVLEYDLLFDTNIAVLQGRECPSIANCTPPPAQACPPCNYASKSDCGKAPAGCPACPAADVALYCDPNTDWVEVQLDDEPLLDLLIDTGTNVEFRWYFNNTMACRGAQIKLSTIYGDPDIETLQVLGSAPYLGWTSLNSGGEELTVCPTDPGWGIGTWSLSAYGYLSALTTFRILTSDILTTETPFVPCNLSSEYTCVQGDAEYQITMPEQIDFHYSYYAYPVPAGPCPRFFSMYVQNIAPEALYTRVAFSLVQPKPDPSDRTMFEDMYIFEDFSRHKGTISFCPADTSVPTLVYITIVKENPEQSSALLRVTSSPSKIKAVPLPSIAETDYDLGHKMLQYVMARSPSLLLMPCDSFYGTDQCKLYPDDERAVGVMAPTPPYNETNILNPPWPWLWVTKRSPSVVDGSTAVPLSSTMRQDKFSFTIIARTELTQDGVAARSIYIDTEEYEAMQFRFRGHIVDPDTGMPILTDWTNVTAYELPCTQESFFELKTNIVSVLEQLQGGSNETTARLLALLDYYNFQDTWAGCLEKLRTYLVADTNSSVIVRDTTICTPELTEQDDPCCSLDGLWGRCCRPRDVELPVTSYPELVSSLIKAQCPNEETCMEQFLNEYRADAQSKIDFATGCSGSSLQRDTFFRRSNAFWKSCMDDVFGESLSGISCAMDSDCTDTSVGAMRCDMNTHSCVYQPDTLARRFLECFLANADPFIRVYLVNTELKLNGTVNDTDLVDLLFNHYQTSDCLPNFNVDPSRSRHYTWQNFGCVYLCDPDPLCLYDLCTLPLACMWQGFPSTECTRDPLWAFSDVTQADCQSASYAGECNSLNPPSSSCDAGSFCGVCDTDHCWELPGITDAATCNNTWVCASPVANSQYQVVTDPAQCATQSSCTATCWDGTQEVPCTTQQACEAAGSCSDYDVFTSDTDPEGACLLPVQPWLFGSSCLADYSLVGSSTTFLGCINSTASQAECPSQGLVDEGRFGRWYTRARTEAACLGHGSGCQQLTPLDVSSSIIPQFLTPKNTSECSACGFTPQPYYEWTPGRWVSATARQPQWRTRTSTPLVSWRSGFGYNLLGDAMTSAITERYDLQVRTEQSCRFNRVLQSLGGVACSCLSSQLFGKGDKCIEQRLDASVAIGVSEPCGGRATTVTAVPFTLEFDDQAVPSGRCVNVQLFSVSRLDFRYVKIVSPGSTFIPKPSRDRFQFINSKKAVIGEFLLDGIEAQITRTGGSRPPFRLCVLDDGNNTLLNEPEFPVLDFAIAEADGKTFRPLNINITVLGSRACGLIDDPSVSLDAFTVFLVHRKANWQTLKFRLFNSGEKALLILSGIFYVAATAFCVFVAVEMFMRKSITYQLQIVWPIMILFIVRFVYWFVLAGGGLQSEKFKPEEFFLTDFPLNLYISVMAYLVTFWVLIVARKVNLFLPLVAVFNIPLYLLFITMIILMRYLPYNQQSTFLSCQIKDDPYWTNRRKANVAYKIFLAIVCLCVAAAFLLYGRRIYLWLRKVERTMERAAGTKSNSGGALSWLSNSMKILISALFSTASLIITCVFLLILATISWRSTVFGCLFLWFIELLPLVLLLYLARQQKSENVDSSDPAGKTSGQTNTQTDPSGAGTADSTHAAQSFEFRPWDEEGGVQQTTN